MHALVNLKEVGVMPFYPDLLKVLDSDRAGVFLELGKRNKSKGSVLRYLASSKEILTPVAIAPEASLAM